ncbi:major facilitator superfamily domain-containing protein [Xylariales sp. PMI_506]|nr:major facilitator superfamily domain-containing protein [Xylariales sp. PMI_506]
MPVRSVSSIELNSARNRAESRPAPPEVPLIRDGGYGWVVVFACFVQTFWVNAWTGSWGVIQAAILLQTSSFTVGNIGGLFASGALYGVGGSLMYTMSNSLPVQWFDSRLGTANGLVKLGGGIGATVMALVVQLLIDRIGIPWTFRVMALASLASGIPTAQLIKERAIAAPSVEMGLFKNLNFSLLFTAGFVGIFSLYIPSFFLPSVATSIGLSSTTAAVIMACYNGFMAMGRLSSGIACDRFGSTKMLLLTMSLNAATMLGIWSVASTMPILVAFAALNGIANGAFFVTMPTAIGKLLGPRAASAGIGMAVTGWSVGDLLGNPIAGFLIAATQADHAASIVPYRAAIFYAGGTAAFSTVLILAARLKMNTNLLKKL